MQEQLALYQAHLGHPAIPTAYTALLHGCFNGVSDFLKFCIIVDKAIAILIQRTEKETRQDESEKLLVTTSTHDPVTFYNGKRLLSKANLFGVNKFSVDHHFKVPSNPWCRFPTLDKEMKRLPVARIGCRVPLSQRPQYTVGWPTGGTGVPARHALCNT